jgi:hypothetical protein
MCSFLGNFLPYGIKKIRLQSLYGQICLFTLIHLHPVRTLTRVGLGISAKKLFRGRRNRRNKWLFPTEFRLFCGKENPHNTVSNPSAEEKITRNFIPLNKNRRKLSEFPSEHFNGRENNSKFRSMKQI